MKGGGAAVTLPCYLTILHIPQERVKAGLERARAQGKRLGRPQTPEVVERKTPNRQGSEASVSGAVLSH